MKTLNLIKFTLAIFIANFVYADTVATINDAGTVSLEQITYSQASNFTTEYYTDYVLTAHVEIDGGGTIWGYFEYSTSTSELTFPPIKMLISGYFYENSLMFSFSQFDDESYSVHSYNQELFQIVDAIELYFGVENSYPADYCW